MTGLLVTAVALGAGQLVAGAVGRPAFPVVAVGQSAIDLAPQSLRSFAIRTFGPSDKSVLVAGIVVVLALGSALVGIVAMRRPQVGYIALAALGALGVAAALSRPASRPSWALPSIVAALTGAASFALLRWSTGFSSHEPSADAPTDGLDRRRFLGSAIGLSAVAVVGMRLGSFLSDRRLASASRAAVAVPTPASPAAALRPGAELQVPGITTFYTPNDEFYRVDTALFTPQVRAEEWRLRIHGMVERELELDFGDLLARPMIERDITLNCVSNPVGGPYIGNARWIGTPLKPLLDEAGVLAGAEQVVSRSVDGMTIGTPAAVALDGRDAMLAVAMNGEPLPLEHGFPVRMLVPGLYGYESATKWIVDMELTSFAAYDAYWVRRGWAQVAEIQTISRIDRPRDNAALPAGVTPVAGVAWAQHRGIERVEVRVDGGPWNEAELSTVDSIDTWRQWVWRWDATPGDHVLEVRAADGTGAIQTPTERPPFPSGATGWHTIRITVA